MQEQYPDNYNDEISLKELIIKAKEWWHFLLSQWKWIVLVGLLGGAVGLAWAILSKPSYTARLTFVLEEDEGNPLGSYAGLASQFGINIGGGASGVFTGANIKQLLKSRRMIEKALLSSADTGKGKQTLADRYIQIYKMDKGWEEKPELANLSFPYGVDRSGFSLQQDSILKQMYLAISKEQLTAEKPNEESGIIEVTLVSPDEIFSKNLTNHLVEEVTEFYVGTKTKRSRSAIDRLQVKADSIERLLNEKTYSLAARQDMNVNPIRQKALVGAEVATREKVILQTIFGEVVKNLEISKLSLIKETPLIQIIDRPILPLQKDELSMLKGLVIGGFLGGFLIVLVLIGGHAYHEVMEGDEGETKKKD